MKKISFSDNQLKGLLNVYTNDEIAELLKVSRERVRQIRLNLDEAQTNKTLHELRRYETLRKTYFAWAKAGSWLNGHESVRDFAKQNDLPWPPCLFDKEKSKYSPKKHLD
jgi:hypothetical protein